MSSTNGLRQNVGREAARGKRGNWFDVVSSSGGADGLRLYIVRWTDQVGEGAGVPGCFFVIHCPLFFCGVHVLEVCKALGFSSAFAGFIELRDGDADQDSEDEDNDHDLDQGETTS